MNVISHPTVRRVTFGVLGAGIISASAAGVAQAASLSDPANGGSGGCTVAQAQATLQRQHPDIYAKIMKYDTSAQNLADTLALSPSARADSFAKSHPRDNPKKRQKFLGVNGWSENERHAAKAAINEAATTCKA